MKRRKVVANLLPVYIGVICIMLLISIAGNKLLNVMVQNDAPVRRHCIVIDAGHGGVDGGATSCTGVLESNLNLQIAQKLNDLLHLLGIHTKMIRTTDISVYTEGESIAAKKVSDLKQRIKIINNTADAVLVSIHQNYFSESRYSGAQVFYSTTSSSKLLAENTQNAFVQNLNIGSKRQAKKAENIYLMQKINCPGILVECGFISNHSEESLLRSDLYQRKICCVLASELSKFIHNHAVT